MGDHEDMRCDGQGHGYAQAWSSTSELREAVSTAAATPMDRHTHHPRRVSAFRARSSSLSEGQQKVWDRSWPTYGRLARDPDGSCPPLDTAAWFGRTAPLILEIGCGTGTSTASMALQEPGFDVLAVEVYCKGLAQLLSAIDRAGIENIRLIRGDALDVLEYLLAPGSLTAARVFFPDPWPKARHHKRRLLQPSTVALLSDRLRLGGTLHVATDHANYAAHIARVGDNEPTLRRLELDDPRIPVSVNRPVTKFEGKAHTVGSAISDFVWERV